MHEGTKDNLQIKYNAIRLLRRAIRLYYLILLDAPERIVSKELWMIRDDLSNCMKSISSENLATPTGYDSLAGINPVEGNECSIIAMPRFYRSKHPDAKEAGCAEKIILASLPCIRYNLNKLT
jgi:hypothetical protein